MFLVSYGRFLIFCFKVKVYPSKNNFVMTTILESFSQHITDFVNTHILTTIVSYLSKEKNCNVTVDELRSCLSIPSSLNSAPRIAIPQTNPVHPPTLPNYAPITVSGRSKKDNVEYNGPRCTYRFIRGEKRGEICNQPCEEGKELCRSCSKKKNARREKEVSATSQTSTPTSGFISGSRDTSDTDEGDLHAIPLKGSSNLYRTVQHGFILKKMGDRILLATGIDPNGDGKIRPLNESEKAIATQLGIAYLDDCPTNSGETSEEKSSGTSPGTTSAVPKQVLLDTPKIPPLSGIGTGISVPTIPKFQPAASRGMEDGKTMQVTRSS